MTKRREGGVTGRITLVLALFQLTRSAHAAVPCQINEENVFANVCKEKIHHNSRCVNGFCSNPFQEGCLHTHDPIKWPRKRICNSHDKAQDWGQLCEPSPQVFDYSELRILAQNWDATMLSSWVMQMVLSEMVRVPVSLETSSQEAVMNFYDPLNRFDYPPVGYDYDALRRGNEFRDCEVALRDDPNRPCAHVMPEAWNGQNENIKLAEDEGFIEPSAASGGVAKYSWFIPRFLAELDHTLLSHFGLRGDANREKLANLFHRPTTWGDYCREESANNCTTADKVAARAPQDEAEANQYFEQGVYTGFFRPTHENNCQDFPETCTGHITNVVCTWSTFLVPQAYYLGIHVKSSGPDINGGYPYSRMLEIYQAANATRSPIMVYWFQPDPMLQEFVGSDFEMQEVLLPFPTQKCVDSRVTETQRCAAKFEDQLGDPEGSCDAEAHSYQKLIVSSLSESNSLEFQDAKQNPAYEAIKNFRISDLQLNDMFRYWYERDIDRWNYDPREAACRWVIENVNDLERFIPRSHPRTFESSDPNTPFKYVAIGFGFVSCLAVVVIGFLVHHHRQKRVIKNAQIEFIVLILVGLLLVSVGSILVASEPSDAICISLSWAVVLGYTMELVPLLVKVQAINTLIRASQKMQRIQLSRRTLFGSVLLLVTVASAFMVCWTIFDPWTRQEELILTDRGNEFNGKIVTVSYSCGSEVSSAWIYASLAWQVLLLLCTSVLAFQNRNNVKEFNESRRLVFMVYSHMVFLILRLTFLFLESSVTEDLTGVQSLVLSLDTIATIIIYFVPIFLSANENNKKRSSIMVYLPGSNPFKKWSSRNKRSGVSSEPIRVPPVSEEGLRDAHSEDWRAMKSQPSKLSSHIEEGYDEHEHEDQLPQTTPSTLLQAGQRAFLSEQQRLFPSTTSLRRIPSTRSLRRRRFSEGDASRVDHTHNTGSISTISNQSPANPKTVTNDTTGDETSTSFAELP